MKKVIAILLFSSAVIVSCAKKEDPNKESNVMLPEPSHELVEGDSPVVDSTSTQTSDVVTQDSIQTAD